MKALTYLPPALLLLAAVAACGASEDIPSPYADAALEASTAAQAPSGFDWDKWEAVVNSEPCGWLTDEFMTSIGVAGAGEPERSSSGVRCIWRNDDGTPAFSAGIHLFDSAANLSGDRHEAIRLAGEMPAFTLVGSNTGTVTSVYRSDRGQLSMYPNSDDERVMIAINAHHTLQDTQEQKQEKSDRARAYTLSLIETYSL